MVWSQSDEAPPVRRTNLPFHRRGGRGAASCIRLGWFQWVKARIIFSQKTANGAGWFLWLSTLKESEIVCWKLAQVNITGGGGIIPVCWESECVLATNGR